MQRKLHSFAEAHVNVIVGYPITWMLYRWVVPWLFHIEVKAGQAIGLTVMFTITSLLRQYVIRRWFNRMEKR